MATVTGTLEQIRTKVRRITGRLSENQLSNDDLDLYINNFYVYKMSEHVKLWNLKTSQSPLVATPTTLSGDEVLTPGQWLYVVDSNKYIDLAPPFYVAGYEIAYYQDSRSFFNYFNIEFGHQTLATGTGIAGPYTGTVSNTPVLPESIFITAEDAAGITMVCNANAAGTLTGDVAAGGTINYDTGAVAGLTFTNAVANGTAITVQSLTYVEGRPQAVLYLNQVLTFYPVPDTAYEFFCTVYYVPDELGAGDQPEIRAWWDLIAYGAALDIFVDAMDMENYGKLRPIFEEQIRLISRRTLTQLSTQKVATIYDNEQCFCPSWINKSS